MNAIRLSMVPPLLTLMALSHGCDQGPPASMGPAPASTTETRFGEMIATWEAGSQNEAVRQFVALDWSSPGALAQVPLLNISEDEFSSLSTSQRTQRQEEALALIGTLRGVARQTIAAAEAAETAGDKETARQLYQAIAEFGKALASPGRLLVIQQVGRAYEKLGAEKSAETE